MGRWQPPIGQVARIPTSVTESGTAAATDHLTVWHPATGAEPFLHPHQSVGFAQPALDLVVELLGSRHTQSVGPPTGHDLVHLAEPRICERFGQRKAARHAAPADGGHSKRLRKLLVEADFGDERPGVTEGSRTTVGQAMW